MAINALNLDLYPQSLDDDKEDPKTVFVMEPLDQFEYMKVASVYRKMVGYLGVEDEDDFSKLLDFFDSADADKFKVTFHAFLKEKIHEIKNIRNNDGNLVDLKKGEFNVAIIPPMDGMKLMAQAIARMSVTGKERKN